MEKLFDDSQRQFHDIFKRTYGVLYEKNSHVFREYFSQLRHYFYQGKVDLTLATRTFFATLYQKMFQVSSYTASEVIFDNHKIDTPIATNKRPWPPRSWPPECFRVHKIFWVSNWVGHGPEFLYSSASSRVNGLQRPLAFFCECSLVWSVIPFF